MLSLLLVAITYIATTNGCSIAYPSYGTYYIAGVELLDATQYPDQVLIKIQRSSLNTGSTRLTFDDTNNQWYKVMNVNDGSVSGVVDYNTYAPFLRNYASSDTDPTSTSVECEDACDGTATCAIIRNGITYNIPIPFAASNLNGCSPNAPVLVTLGGFQIAFTINDISTTYISLSSNMAGIVWNDATTPATYQVITVDTEGDFSNLIPGGWGADSNPKVYSTGNVIQTALPCCLCYGWSLTQYSINPDPTGVYDQVMTLTSMGFGGGYVDDQKLRAFNWGLGYSSQVSIYDLSTGAPVVGSPFEPDLCDFMANCLVDPCQSSSCPYNPTAVCRADYCGGCNARWYCGESDITMNCDSTPQQTFTCPTPTPEPTPAPTVDICTLPSDVGSCNITPLERRFYWDTIRGGCRRFGYGGCDGNANNFQTRTECNAACRP